MSCGGCGNCVICLNNEGFCACGQCEQCVQRYHQYMALQRYTERQNNLYYINANGYWTNFQSLQGPPGLQGPQGPQGAGGPLYSASLWTSGDNNFCVNYASTNPSVPTGLPLSDPSITSNSIFPFTEAASFGNITPSTTSSNNTYWFTNASPSMDPIPNEVLYDGFILPADGVYELSYTLCSIWSFPSYSTIVNISFATEPELYPYNSSLSNFIRIYYDPASTLSVRVLRNNMPIEGSAKTIYDETNIKNLASISQYWNSFPSLTDTIVFKGKANDKIQLANNNGLNQLFVFNTFPAVDIQPSTSASAVANVVTLTYPGSYPRIHDRSMYIAVLVTADTDPTSSLTVTDSNNNAFALVSATSIVLNAGGTAYLSLWYLDYTLNSTDNASDIFNLTSYTVTINNTFAFTSMYANVISLNNTATQSKGAVTLAQGTSSPAGSVLNLKDVNNAVLTYVIYNDAPTNVSYALNTTNFDNNTILYSFIYHPTGLTNQPDLINYTSTNPLSWKSLSVEVNVGYYPLFIDTPSSMSMNIKMLYPTSV